MLGAALLALLSRAVTRGPREDVLTGMASLVCRAYCRAVHRLKVEGAEHIPPRLDTGLIVVANHASGLDPLAVQAALPYFVRWMMMESMMLPALAGLWEWLEIIPVSGRGRELTSARAAIRALESGAVVGIFPEGAIERPARTLLPFVPGVGLIIAKTGAPVLPVVIEGAPYAASAWGSLFRTSRTRVRVMPLIRYDAAAMKPDAIARDLHDRYAAWTGWPAARPDRGDRRRAPGSGGGV